MTHGLYNGEKVLEEEPLQLPVSAQGAKLNELARAVWWGHNQRVSIYTDFKYAFRLCHATSMLWKE